MPVVAWLGALLRRIGQRRCICEASL